jgi:hypothetical protein
MTNREEQQKQRYFLLLVRWVLLSATMDFAQDFRANPLTSDLSPPRKPTFTPSLFRVHVNA